MNKILKIVFTILLYLDAYHTNAQEEVKSFFIDTYKYDYVLTETDSDNNKYYFFYHKNKFEIKIIDRNFNIVGGRIFKIKEFNKHWQPIGIGYETNYMYVFFLDLKSKNVIRLVYDKKNIATPKFSIFFSLQKSEHLIHGTNIKGIYKFICINETTNDFIIRSNSQTFDSLSIQILPSKSQNLKSVFQNNDREIYYSTIKNYTDRIELTTNTSKIYQFDDQLIFTNDSPTETHIFSLNISKKECTYNTLFWHIQGNEDSELLGGNSAIKDNRLFRITRGSHILNFSIVDLEDFSLVKNQNIKGNSDEIHLSTTIPQIDVEFEDRADTKSYIKSSDEFLDFLDNDALAIAITDNNDHEYSIQLGSSKLSYYTVTAPGYGPNFGMGTWSLSSGGIGLGTPSSIFSTPTTNNYKKVTKVFFRTLIHKDNLKKSNSKIINSTPYNELKIFENNKVNTVFSRLSTIIENENEIIYGYFNGKDDLYHLIKFKNKNEN